MNRSKNYYQCLKSFIHSRVELSTFTVERVGEILDEAMEWHKNQTLMKRPPKVDRGLCYYVICEAWMEAYLKSTQYEWFDTYEKAENHAWIRLAPTGYLNAVGNYDTLWIRLIMQYRKPLKEWWNNGTRECVK